MARRPPPDARPDGCQALPDRPVLLLAHPVTAMRPPRFRLATGPADVAAEDDDPWDGGPGDGGPDDGGSASWPAIRRAAHLAAAEATVHRFRVDRGPDEGAHLVVVSGGPGTAAVVLEPSAVLGPPGDGVTTLALVADDRLAVVARTAPSSPTASGRPASTVEAVRALAARLLALAGTHDPSGERPPVLRCSVRGRFAIFELEGP
ncbi:MAG: hypothetical protein AAF962_27905 [Actinomycetota bacterium]